MSKELTKFKDKGLKVFDSADNFELAQRAAKMLAASTLVPKEYQGKIENCVIALEMASRIGASPLMVMQHLYIVHGKPSWSSSFLISAINTSGKFEPLRFDIKKGELKTFEYSYFSGFGQNRKLIKKNIKLNDLKCVAWTHDKNGERLEAPEVTIEMALTEGWYDKDGSKWKTMPELMIRYRSASFFSRLYCPEITMGMQTAEEVIDVVYEDITDQNKEVIAEKKKDMKDKKQSGSQTKMDLP
jgi:hypothetical protein